MITKTETKKIANRIVTKTYEMKMAERDIRAIEQDIEAGIGTQGRQFWTVRDMEAAVALHRGDIRNINQQIAGLYEAADILGVMDAVEAIVIEELEK